MILQSENPIRMVCEFKGAKLSIIIVLGLVHQRVSQEWLERNTGYTDKTISQALAYLEEHGFTDHTNAGWQLTSEKARQLVMPLELEEENSTEQEKKGNVVIIDADQDENFNPSRTEEQRSGSTNKQNAGRNNSDSLNYLSKKEEVVINNLNTSSNSLNLSNKDGKIPTLEEIQQVLEAAAKLFGHEIVGEPRDYADLDRLLAWITQAYDRRGIGRGKIENPPGMVYWAFHQGKDRAPEKKYTESWCQDRCLPEPFKRNSGQWDFEDEEENDE